MAVNLRGLLNCATLGFVKSRTLKCYLDASKRGFYRAVNSILAKLGVFPLKKLSYTLLRPKYTPILLSQAALLRCLYCGKAHVQSQFERANFWPKTSKSLKLFKFELDLHDYIPEISANFHFNPFSGASPRIDELLRFCDFFLVSYLVILYFFSGTRPGRTVDGFSRFMAHATCFVQWRSFWGLREYRNSFGVRAP